MKKDDAYRTRMAERKAKRDMNTEDYAAECERWRNRKLRPRRMTRSEALAIIAVASDRQSFLRRSLGLKVDNA